MEGANAGGRAFLRLRQPHFRMESRITRGDTGVVLVSTTTRAKARLTHVPCRSLAFESLAFSFLLRYIQILFWYLHEPERGHCTVTFPTQHRCVSFPRHEIWSGWVLKNVTILLHFLFLAGLGAPLLFYLWDSRLECGWCPSCG